MTKPEAVGAVRKEASVRLQTTIELRANGHRSTVTLGELGQRSNAAGAVNRALAIGESMGTFSRFWHRFNDEPVGEEIELSFSGTGRVDAVLTRFAHDVARQTGELPISPSRTASSDSWILGRDERSISCRHEGRFGRH